MASNKAAQERKRHDREHELAHAELRTWFFLGVPLRRRAGRGVVGIRVLDREFLFGLLREVAPRRPVRFASNSSKPNDNRGITAKPMKLV